LEATCICSPGRVGGVQVGVGEARGSRDWDANSGGGPGQQGRPCLQARRTSDERAKRPHPPPPCRSSLEGWPVKKSWRRDPSSRRQRPKGLALSPVIGTSWRPVDSEGSPVCERGKFKDLETLRRRFTQSSATAGSRHLLPRPPARNPLQSAVFGPCAITLERQAPHLLDP
jgi:hypothetical protein